MRLAGRIIKILNEIPHETYAEPFVGMGGIFLRRNFKPSGEVINDYSADVTNFFRILRHHYLPFMDLLRWLISSRDEWDRLMATPPETMTDLQRAVRFLYIQRLGFGGKVAGRNFGMVRGRGARFDVLKLAPMLDDLHDRLASVTIERLHYADFIMKYDRPGTLFYLDPPYFGCEDDYGNDMFVASDFETIADLVRDLKGRFVLSINDHPEIRLIFKGFKFEEVEVSYSLSPDIEQGKKFGELIITN